MALVTLAEVKAHLRLDTNDEDTLLTMFAEAATEYVQNVTRAPWDVPEEVPFSVKAATLLVAADLFENREAQSVSKLYVNETALLLLWPYRVF
jgi:uncharacterized phage protein (predicted DNA packaging)